MVRITIDDTLKQQLLSAGEAVDLCDASGKVLARAVPNNLEATTGTIPFTAADLPPGMSAEEFDRRRTSDDWGGMTTAEVHEYLRSRS